MLALAAADSEPRCACRKLWPATESPAGPGEPLLFDAVDDQIKLYKIHGSLDWSVAQDGAHLSAPRITVDDLDSSESRPCGEGRPRRSKRQPWIVIGDGEKVATDGPVLSLINAAENALHRSDRLLVVGYSFSDVHVDAMIRNWMSAAAHRTITVLDRSEIADRDSFRGPLMRAYGASPRSKMTPRISFVIGSAGTVLEEALNQFPLPIPDLYVDVRGRQMVCARGGVGSERN